MFQFRRSALSILNTTIPSLIPFIVIYHVFTIPYCCHVVYHKRYRKSNVCRGLYELQQELAMKPLHVGFNNV